jgi:CheY-like chemotaxis protein
VKVTSGADLVHVSVRDTGPGIAPDELERIFEPFQQARGTVKQQMSGAGLGLSLSREFVELHGGRLWAESTPGVGSTFHFELPRRAPVAPVERPHRWIQEEWEWMASQARLELPDDHLIPRVVVHGASPELARALRRYSEQVEMVFSSDLDAALSRASDYPTHAVVLCGAIPDDVLERVQVARQALADVPVTGCCVEQAFTVPHIAGTRDHLVKPISRGDLAWMLSSMEKPVHDILLVDDDPEVQFLLTRMLQIIDGTLQVTSVSDAESALAAARTDAYDLILLDLVLPGMDGVAFIREKSADPAIQDVPVVVISAQDRLSQPPVATMIALTKHEGVSPRNLLKTALAFATIQASTARPQLPELG